MLAYVQQLQYKSDDAQNTPRTPGTKRYDAIAPVEILNDHYDVYYDSPNCHKWTGEHRQNETVDDCRRDKRRTQWKDLPQYVP
jgi:hypothetical protein